MNFKSVALIALTCAFISCSETPSNKSQSSPSVETDELTLEKIDALLANGANASADLYFERAKLSFNSGNLQGSAQDILKAIALDSTQVEYFHFLSDVQLNAFQSRRALESLNKAVSLEPNNRQSLLKLMELQILLKQYIPAVATSQKLLSMDPQDDQVFFLRGLLFKEQNADSLAIINLQRTADLNPEMTDAFIMLGDLHEKQSSPLAKGYYENALRADPENINALHAYAFYLQNHDDTEKALEIYDRMIDLNTAGPAPLVNSAVIHMDGGNFEKAKGLLVQAEALDSTFALTPFYLGECLSKMGETDEAKKAFQRSLDIDPEFRDAQRALKSL